MRIGKLSILVMTCIVVVMVMPVGYFVLPNATASKEQAKPPFTGIAAYLINLERSKERLKFVKPQIEQLHIPLIKIDAIDGYKLTPQDFAQKADFKAYHTFLGQSPKIGIIGCSLSHIKAWQTFLNSNYEFAIIFEDDISFDPQIVNNTIQLLLANRQYWDIANLETHHRGLPIKIKQLDDKLNMVTYLVEVTHAGAYLINRHAAEKLISKALPIKMPIDHYFTRGWELDLKFVGVEPRIVKQTFGDSNIETSKRKDAQYHPSIGEKITQRIYKIQTNTIRFLYNLWNVVCAWLK